MLTQLGIGHSTRKMSSDFGQEGETPHILNWASEQFASIPHAWNLLKISRQSKINISLPVKSPSKTEAPNTASHNHNVLLVHFAGSNTQTPGSHNSGEEERSAHKSVLLNSTKQKYVKPSWWRRNLEVGVLSRRRNLIKTLQCKWAIRR